MTHIEVAGYPFGGSIVIHLGVTESPKPLMALSVSKHLVAEMDVQKIGGITRPIFMIYGTNCLVPIGYIFELATLLKIFIHPLLDYLEMCVSMMIRRMF